ncbi:MAG: sodium ion-translocating decarboxylase subunit beta [Treponemataceae bacterium]|nr:sodium ion-translocating decarboxylase subunit beta [Treponemataceae bacterium]
MADVFAYFAKGILALGWQQVVMYGIGGLLIWLAVAKKYEPMLLLPIGFGAILVNLPLEVVWEYDSVPGALKILFEAGVLTELFPLLIFVGVGAMIDFRPLLQRPWMLVFGIVAHGGIVIAAAAAHFLGFSLEEAASIGTIGAADGPTAIFVTAKFAPEILGQVAVAAYSYMSVGALL